MNDICREIKLRMSFYIDGELSGEEKQQLEQHLEVCPQCRDHFHELQKTTSIISDALSSRPEIDFEKVLQNIKSEIQKPASISLMQRIAEWLKMPKIWVPATAFCTAALIFFFSVPVLKSPETTQMSRVESVSSRSGMYMVLETAQTKQPLIWFTEPPAKESHS